MDNNQLRKLAGLPPAVKKPLLEGTGSYPSLAGFNLTLVRKMAGLPVLEKEDEEVPAEEPAEEPAETDDEAVEAEVPAIITKIAAKAEGKTGEDLVGLIGKVYDAGFKDGVKSTEEPKEEKTEEPVEEGLRDARGGTDIKAGDKLIWTDANGDHAGTVVADPKFNGGLKVGGRSVKNIIDDSDKVMVVEAARKDLAAKKATAAPAATPAKGAPLTTSIGVDKEGHAGDFAVELAKAGMTVDMEEAMGVFYFNFKKAADGAKALELAKKNKIAMVESVEITEAVDLTAKKMTAIDKAMSALDKDGKKDPSAKEIIAVLNDKGLNKVFASDKDMAGCVKVYGVSSPEKRKAAADYFTPKGPVK